jgi:hypothetical protein
MWGAILQDLYDVMYMFINHGKTIDDLKKCGRVAMRKTFTNIGLVMHGQITSRLITINLVSDNVCHALVFKFFL